MDGALVISLLLAVSVRVMSGHSEPRLRVRLILGTSDSGMAAPLETFLEEPQTDLVRSILGGSGSLPASIC